MINVFIDIIIFCVVLFLYIHIYFHLKVSDEYEIFEIEHASKDKMEEICDLRQPILFSYDNMILKNTTTFNYIYKNYPSFDIKIRDMNTLYNNSNNLFLKGKNDVKDTKNTNTKNIDINKYEDIYIPLKLSITHNLFEKVSDDNIYISENNNDFLNESGIIKNMYYNDKFLRPYFISNCFYDIILGTKNSITPLRYEINYRNFFLLTEGSVKVKLTIPKNKKYLYTYKDYDNFEFRSLMNVWNIQNEFKDEYNKVKFLEVTLYPENYLFIPAYWWYSFKFNEKSSISVFKYRTYFNNIAIANEFMMYILQSQNIKNKITNTYL